MDVIERDAPGSGATASSFAWINATYDKTPESYYRLSRAGVEAWRRLEAEVSELELRWSGSVEWAADRSSAEELQKAISRHRSWGADVSLLESEELERLEPGLAADDLVLGCRSPEEAYVEPGHAVDVLLRSCQELGVRVCSGVEVSGIRMISASGEGEQVAVSGIEVRKGVAEERNWTSDSVVLAAGTATDRLAALVGGQVPLIRSPGVLLTTSAVDFDPQHVVLSPDVHFRKTSSGALLAGLDFGGDPNGADEAAAGERISGRLRERLPGAIIEARRAELGFRPMPTDGLPILGPLPQFSRAYVAVMHSGITLAPLVGELVSNELLDGTSDQLLDPFRPDRFFN